MRLYKESDSKVADLNTVYSIVIGGEGPNEVGGGG